MICTIKPVIVCKEDVISRLAFGVLPAAMETIIVSPIALETAKTTDAIIPETAAGSTTLNVVSNLVAPSPSDPSRVEFGTELIASSLKLAIIGMIMIPTTSPALTALYNDIPL